MGCKTKIDGVPRQSVRSANFTLELWVRCCHPSSSHKETHGDLGPGIDQPDIGEVRGGEIVRSRNYDYFGDHRGRGGQFTFALPSVFVFPFGGSMITRVSIDPPSMAHWHRGEVCKKQKADVFCCQANAEGCPCPVLAGWPNFPAIPKMLQFVILFLELVIGCRNPSEEISPKMIKKYPRWNQNTLAMFIYTKEAQD